MIQMTPGTVDGVPVTDGPLARARLHFQEARARVEDKDTPAHRAALEAARTHLDYLLDTLPLPRETPPQSPSSPVAHRPGLEVSYAVNTTGQAERVVSLADDLMAMGTQEDVDECTPTTQQDTDSEDV